MPKIDISGWGEFRIGDLFTQERGKESSPNRVEDGILPMVNEINTNNGIAKFGKSSNVILGNCITVSVNYATNVFYQKDDFCASVNILVLRSVNINEYSGKFISGILSRNNLKYDYTNKISKDRLNDEIIKLPTDPQGNPDWQYMEEYMRNIEVRVSTSLSKLESAKEVENKKIDISGWGKVKIGKYFDIKNGIKYPKNIRTSGNLPLVSTSAFNNGISDYIEDRTDSVYQNCITVAYSGSVGATFFQEQKVFVGETVLALLPKFEINHYIGEFILTVMGEHNKKYDYNYKIKVASYGEDEIYLPIDSKGNPDWLYMENYMKALEIKVKGFLDKTA